jgi:hypothetical protein
MMTALGCGASSQACRQASIRRGFCQVLGWSLMGLAVTTRAEIG